MADNARGETKRGRRRTGRARIVGALLFALMIAGVATVERPVVQGAQVSVVAQDYAFAPVTLTVPIGTTVTWTNQGADVHTTTSEAGLWDSGTLHKGASFSFTFTKAGTFAYHCTFHQPAMHGTIVVTPAETPTPTATLRPTNTPPPTATPTPTPVPTLSPTPVPPGVTPIPPTPTTARATASATTTATASATAASSAAANTPTATTTGTPFAPPPSSGAASSAAPVPQLGPLSLLPFSNFVEPIRPFTDTPDHRFFAATNHSLNFGFKSYWERYGGLAQFGYPISEEFLERGADGAVRTVQYFERARFEYHYDLSTVPFSVQVAMLGMEMTAGRASESAFLPVSAGTAADGQFFAATSHTLSGPFAAFWQTGGGLETFGNPISEPLQETGADGVARTVQYFERYRFEMHAETNGVELGRLGLQVAQARGYVSAA